MSPPAHFASSWLLADWLGKNRRERALLTAAGVAPDLDGAGYLIDRFTGRTDLYDAWHHVYGHGLVGAVAVALIGAALTRTRQAAIAVSAFAIFHVHLALDLLSGKGPDDRIWGIRYFYPMGTRDLSWQGQWYLHDWKNAILGLLLIFGICYFARKRGRSPIEIASTRLDAVVRSSFASVFQRSS